MSDIWEILTAGVDEDASGRAAWARLTEEAREKYATFVASRWLPEEHDGEPMAAAIQSGFIDLDAGLMNVALAESWNAMMGPIIASVMELPYDNYAGGPLVLMSDGGTADADLAPPNAMISVQHDLDVATNYCKKCKRSPEMIMNDPYAECLIEIDFSAITKSLVGGA